MGIEFVREFAVRGSPYGGAMRDCNRQLLCEADFILTYTYIVTA